MSGFSIRIHIPDGNPTGARTIEKSNWIGRGIFFPRNAYEKVSTWGEYNKVGVYILIGPEEGSDVPRIYIGEGDPVKSRIDTHYRNKEFWTFGIFFVSKDDNLHKSLVQYLEAKLISIASRRKRSILENSNFPTEPSLSAMDKDDIDSFLQEILLCLPVLGVNVFEEPVSRDEKPERRLKLFIKAVDCDASGIESDEGFVVFKGSKARISETASLQSTYIEIRKNLIDRGIFTTSGQCFVLTQDYVFNTPSAAATVMMGRSASGPREWKDKNGRLLESIRAGNQ